MPPSFFKDNQDALNKIVNAATRKLLFPYPFPGEYRLYTLQLGEITVYRQGIILLLEQALEFYWGVPFAQHESDGWSGPNMEPCQGEAILLRDAEFKPWVAPIMLSSTPFGHGASNMTAYFKRRFEALYKFPPHQIFRKTVGDTTTSQVAAMRLSVAENYAACIVRLMHHARELHIYPFTHQLLCPLFIPKGVGLVA